ncbi:MAG: CD225/dispanin family protein [Corynebacterium sp.]|uniref:CD225/dispanin family protein n=1 Tax=Corynebacterium sp. TaxID=1720 RepID=UPI0026DAF58C|nr:CD225/dispanin family protein [Corynebacterium sp.]MDO4761641.1 CD225/dispanin family protein [Corynebacterium sp.]
MNNNDGFHNPAIPSSHPQWNSANPYSPMSTPQNFSDPRAHTLGYPAEPYQSAAVFPEYLANNPQPSMYGQAPVAKPKDYMLLSVLSAIFGFPFLGLISVYFSVKVDKLWQMGRQYDSVRASRQTLTWAIIALVFALIGWLIFGLFIMAVIESLSKY